MLATIEINSYTPTSMNLVNIITGQCAEDCVKTQLTAVKELGTQALNSSLSSNEPVSVPVKLQTFYTQNQKPKKTKP